VRERKKEQSAENSNPCAAQQPVREREREQHEIYDLAYFYKFSDQSNFLNCKTLDCARAPPAQRRRRQAGSRERNMLLHLTLLGVSFFIFFYFPMLFPLHSSPLSKLTLETAESSD
jgi:hypothetical protein